MTNITPGSTCYISGNESQTEPDFQLKSEKNIKRLRFDLGWER